MEHRGMTLLELMVSLALLTIVMGILFVLAASLGAAARDQETKATATDQARAGMRLMVRELRQAAAGTIPWGNLPTNTITFQMAADADGNGVAVDSNGDLELSNVWTLGPDTADANSDGLSSSQLVMTDGATTRILANDLTPDEDNNDNGVLDDGEDLNGNGVLDHGIWFDRLGGGIAVTLDTERREILRGVPMTSSLTEIVIPRN